MKISLAKGKPMFKTMAEVKVANRLIGNHWFSRDTMKFWKSRIETRLYVKTQCFVSSEDEWAMDGGTPQRIYAVRQVEPDGSIKTLGSHIRHLEDAIEYAKQGYVPVSGGAR